MIRDRRPDTFDVAVNLARTWAARLVEMHGMRPPCAALLAAKRYGIADGFRVRVALPVQTSDAWRRGALARPTRRPTRGESDEFKKDEGKETAA